MASISILSLDSLILEGSPSERKPTSFKGVRKFISTQWTLSYRAVLTDLRSVRWARAGLWALFALWTTLLFCLILFFSMYGAASWTFESFSSACRSDGSFNPNISAYNAWEFSKFFEINLGFGSLTFTQAKVIDIIWDITIGRGGQALMAFITWRAFADYVTTSMELRPVTYTVFFAIYLQDEPSIFSTIEIMRDFMSGRVLKSKLSMVFMISSMIFLVAWPTIASAMTGYTTIVIAFVRDQNNNYIKFSDFEYAAYVIHDGQRVNLTENYAIPFGIYGRTVDPLVLERTFMSINQRCYFDESYIEPGCELQYATSRYAEVYGFFGLKNESSLWMNATSDIPSPTLNITAFYVPPRNSYEASRGSGFFGFNWSSTSTPTHKNEFVDPSKMAFSYSNRAYTLDYVLENGRCQTVRDQFKWGFSFLQIFIAIIFLSIWTFGTYTMWLKARFQLPLQGETEVPKSWRAVHILARSMHEEFRDPGIDISSLTNRQLKDAIKKQLNGGSVSFDIPLTRSGYSFRRGIARFPSSVWRWLRREWIWCLVLLGSPTLIYVAAISWPTIGYYGFYIMLCLLSFLWCGVVFAMVVGSTARSRVFMVLCWSLTGAMFGLLLAIGLGSMTQSAGL